MTIPSLIRCSEATAGIATNLDATYTKLFRGYWMIVWFKNREQKTQFWKMYWEAMK